MRPFFLCVVLALLTVLVVSQCSDSETEQKKIVYINSYHPGYGASDEIMIGLKSALANQRVVMEEFFLDAKRNPSEDSIRVKVQRILARIAEFKPDVIITSDDDAVKYVIVPYFKDSDTPVVFCGVNWTAEPYGLPADNVTGMLEILPVKDALDTLRHYFPEARNLMILSENTSTEQKNTLALDTVYRAAGFIPWYALVDDFESWKREFIRGNTDFDLIYMPTNGAISGWDVAQAQQFVIDNIRKPVFTCDDFMMTYAVFGITKVAQEQGQWAARTALQIIDGTDPDEIPLARNTQTQSWINGAIAEKISFVPSERLLKSSKIVK